MLTKHGEPHIGRQWLRSACLSNFASQAFNTTLMTRNAFTDTMQYNCTWFQRETRGLIVRNNQHVFYVQQ